VEFRANFHTVTFASHAVLAQLRRHFVVPTPGKSYFGIFNPAVVLPSSSNGCGTKVACVYSGGMLNSGLLVPQGRRVTPSSG